MDYITLLKCDSFMRCIHHVESGSNSDLEVRKPLLTILKRRTYGLTEKARASYLDHPEVSKRLRHLSAESEGQPFYEVYGAANEARKNSPESLPSRASIRTIKKQASRNPLLKRGRLAVEGRSKRREQRQRWK